MGIRGVLPVKELPSVSGKPGRGSQVPEQGHRCGAAWRGGVCEPLGELECRGEQWGWGQGVPPVHPELCACPWLFAGALCPVTDRGTGWPRAEHEAGRGCSLGPRDKQRG